jgi:alkanesulfonate monooxygenase SsuD/methylene tetrahydromethanopterin reductase-like flavin-dependent oxidoreductase (luciferase family)
MEPPPRQPRLGFGIVARAEEHAAPLGRLGPRLEELGYDELWANDGRGRSGLATVRAAAGSATRLLLGVGVIPLSETSPAQAAAEVARTGLDHARLVVGLGTGDGSSLAVVREGVATLRGLLPDVQVAIAALGPRMCRLGGETADVVLLNWAFPGRIAWSRDRIAEGAAAAGRPMPRVAAYVRVAIGTDARERLVAEANRYRGRPRPYTRQFAAQGAIADQVPGVAAEDPREVPALLAPYRDALDSCVVRALPVGEGVDELIAIAEAAAGR